MFYTELNNIINIGIKKVIAVFSKLKQNLIYFAEGCTFAKQAK